MKRLLLTGLVLAAASAYGALNTATGDLLTDYTAWFAPEFKVASDANYVGVPYPSANIPNATVMDIPGVRDWTGWTANWGASGLKSTLLANPFSNPAAETRKLYIEVVFLGETAGWWDDFGYTIGGDDVLLADSVQTINKNGPKNRWFGDNLILTLDPGESLDFFVTGSGVFGPNVETDPTIGSQGGKYYAFDTDNNLPDGSDMQSYFGTLRPLSSVRDVENFPGILGVPFTVLAFEDIRIRGANRDSDFNDFIFAVRADYDIQQAPVPEPSTYGLIGAAALLALVGYRRFRKV